MLCKTRIGGICGTDIGTVSLRQHPGSMLKKFVSFPMTLGHENVAEVVDVGENVSEITTGQRVVVDPPHNCWTRNIEPQCYLCAEGKPSVCLNFDKGSLPPSLGLGYNNFTGGSWSEYFVAHKSQIYPLPDEISDEDAILIDPLACSLHAVVNNFPEPSENVLVLGAGIIGMGVLMFLKLLYPSAKVCITVKHKFQMELAEKLLADDIVRWDDGKDALFAKLAESSGAEYIRLKTGLRFLRGGFDRIYDCTGNVNGFNDGARMVKPGGKYIIVGTPQLGLADLTSVWFREVKIVGITGRGFDILPNEDVKRHNYEHIIDFIRYRKIKLDGFPRKFYRQVEYKKAIMETINKKDFPYIKTGFDFRWIE